MRVLNYSKWEGCSPHLSSITKGLWSWTSQICWFYICPSELLSCHDFQYLAWERRSAEATQISFKHALCILDRWLRFHTESSEVDFFLHSVVFFGWLDTGFDAANCSSGSVTGRWGKLELCLVGHSAGWYSIWGQVTFVFRDQSCSRGNTKALWFLWIVLFCPAITKSSKVSDEIKTPMSSVCNPVKSLWNLLPLLLQM